MRLTPRERMVLAAVEHRAQDSISSIARELGIKTHTMRYALSYLEKRGIIIGEAPFINLYPLGFTDFTFFFSLASGTARMHEAFLKSFKSMPGISWFAKLGGEYRYAAALCARYIEEASALFENALQEQGHMLVNKTISVRTAFRAMGRRWLSPKVTIPPLYFGCGKARREQVDGLDHKMLALLSDRGDMSERELARLLGVALNTVQRRMARLRSIGVLAGRIYRYNQSELQVQQHRLLLFTRGATKKIRQSLQQLCRKELRAVHLIECIGEWDWEIGVEVHDGEELSDIVQILYQSFGPDLASIRTYQILRHLRYSSYPLSSEKL